MPIGWENLKQQDFDRLVEAYLTRNLAGRGRVVVLEGRGGDGGIDVDFIEPDGTRTIYQLKCFPEGFSGGFVKRRAQITKSFKAAMVEAPAKWVLVVPCKMTRREHRFLQALTVGFKPPLSVVIDHLDQPRLDSGFAEYPDLVSYFYRREVEEVAKLWSRERAALSGGVRDLRARVGGLGRLGDTLDPYWAVDFSYINGRVVHNLRAKSPDAADKSPISIRFRADFGSHQVTLQEKFIRAMEYGPTEALKIPASAVKDFQVFGPEWIAEQREEGVDMEWIPLPSGAVGKALEIRCLDEDGQLAASFRGQVAVLASGNIGTTLTGTFAQGAMTITFLLPADPNEPGTLQFAIPSIEVLPGNLVRALSLRRGLMYQPVAEILLEGERVGVLTFNSRPLPGDEEAEHYTILQELASDLQLVQQYCDIEFSVPPEVSTLDRISLRCLRLLLDGKCVVMPQAQRLTVTLSGHDSPELRATTGAETTTLLLTQDTFGVDLFDQELRVGKVHIYSTRVVCVNAVDVHAALDAGAAIGVRAVLEASEGRHFRFYKPDLWSDPNAYMPVSPWSLTGVAEPVDVEDAHGGAIGLDNLGRPKSLT